MRPLVILIALALIPTADPPPPTEVPHQIIRITPPELRTPAEVAVAVNPLDPDHLVAAAFLGFRPGTGASNGALVSRDGGKTWATQPAPNPDRRIQGDDTVAFGPDGTAYHVYLGALGHRQRRPQRAGSGLFARRLPKGGEWEPPVAIVDHVNSVEPFEDKPWPVVDGVEGSPHKGNLYVGWTRFDVYGSKDPAHKTHTYLSRSRDGGKTFSPPWRLSEKPGDCQDSSNTLMGAMPAVGPRGEVYVVWAGPEGIVFTRSADGGLNFSPTKVLTATPGGWDLPAAGLARHNGLPVIGVDPSDGPNRGAIHVGWIDKRHGDADVFVMTSRDGGEKWGEPVRVNDDERGTGKEQLFTWLAVDPKDGSVNLAFYDRRGLDGTLTGVTLARSVDGGKTFRNHRLKQEPFACHPEVFLGDYLGLTAHGGRVTAVYTHFVDRRQTALSAALFRFKLGTQQGE